MKIYDACIYFDEDILLDLRFNILDKYVHKFVVVESLFTHSGEKKKQNLHFLITKLLGKRFSETQWDSLKMEHVLILEVNI